MATWTKLYADHRDKSGLMYMCASNHEWFVPFVLLANPDFLNECPECVDDPDEVDSTTTETQSV